MIPPVSTVYSADAMQYSATAFTCFLRLSSPAVRPCVPGADPGNLLAQRCTLKSFFFKNVKHNQTEPAELYSTMIATSPVLILHLMEIVENVVRNISHSLSDS